MARAQPGSLEGWLAYLETLHPQAIALGLDRVRAVHARLDAAIACPVVTIAGTNGKGSTAAMLASMLRAAGFRTGLYTSPHILRYNERVVVDGVAADDAALCEAFAAVEAVRGDVALTYFEFGTLAALWLFARRALDALVLEVGLGGRLDAVNIVDADVAVLTRVGIDHVDYLGATREDIGREKAGIFRGRRSSPSATCRRASSRTRRRSVRRCCGSVATSISRTSAHSGATAARGESATGSRCRRCAARSSSPTRRRRSRCSTACTSGCR